MGLLMTFLVRCFGQDATSASSPSIWKLGFEQRVRYEDRTGVTFGRDPDLFTAYARSRVSLTVTPKSWLKISAMAQDGRTPWYGNNAPSNVRDPLDLQEAYFDINGEAKRGLGGSAGRRMLNYGDTRLLGSPQWAVLARTWDQGRAFYQHPKMHLELLFLSPVKPRNNGFNRPVLGEHVWGTYNTFPKLPNGAKLDAYILRHNQNRSGGFVNGSPTATLGTTSYGFRLVHPLPKHFSTTVEAVWQNGHVAGASHKAQAAALVVDRSVQVAGKPVRLTGEYKFASGTHNPSDARRSATFDQLFPANHDKFGHVDLFGWRNIHNTQWSARFDISKRLSATAMFDASWLASRKDALYNLNGRPISQSAAGTAGRFIGREVDLFGTYTRKPFQLGAGGGYFFPGEFVRNTTPGKASTLLYVFHTVYF